MDEDEEVDREGGGRKMSELLDFPCCRIPICKAVSYFSNWDKAFATSKCYCMGVSSFTVQSFSKLPSLPALSYLLCRLPSLLSTKPWKTPIYSHVHVFFAIAFIHVSVTHFACGNI